MSNKEQYRNICAQKTGLPVFLQHWWLDAVAGNWDVAITMKGDVVTGVWPYTIEQKIGVSVIRTPKLTPYIGPHVFFPADLKEVNRDGFEHETINELVKQMRAAKVWHIATQPGLKQAGLFKNEGLQVSVQQTFLIDLKQEETTLFANLKESLRRNIKSANAELEMVNDTSQLHTLFEYQKHTLSRKDVSQAYGYADMRRLMDAAITNNSAALWLAKKQDDIQAMVWNVWDAERSYYFMGAQKPGNDNYKAMPALLWHFIKEAKARGNTYFDLEGSMDPGVERFFRGFGGRRELYLVLKKQDSLLWKLKELIKS